MLLIAPSLVWACLVSLIAAAPANYPPPSQDPFWQPPSGLAATKPGAILKSRQVSTDYDSFASTTWQVLYRTTSALGAPEVSVATLFAPKIPATGVARIMLLLPPTDSACVDCATNYGIITSDRTSYPYTNTAVTDGIDITIGLNKGWYVVLAESQGAHAAFISGITEAFASLDALRSILNFPTVLPNKKGYKAVVHGYSGGGHSSAWTTQYFKSYAPELNLIAGAYGGVPVNLLATLENLNKGLFATFGISAVAGFANVYPKLESWLQGALNTAGKAAFKTSRTTCVTPFNNAFQDDYAYFTKGKAAISEPTPQYYFNLGNLGQTITKNQSAYPSNGKIEIPVFQYHSRSDEIVPYPPVPPYVENQCSRGANIVLSTTLVSEHATAFILYLGDAYIYMENAFNGIKPTGCSTINTIAAPIFSPAYIAAVGTQAYAKILALRGQSIGGVTYSF